MISFFKLPENTDLKKAGPIVCAGCTVYGPIKHFAKEGDTCAVVGIGGLGHLAVKYLLQLGFSVTAITHTKEKKHAIMDLGCKEIIEIDCKEKMGQYKERFDFIINTLPTVEYFNEVMELCAPECKYVMVGLPNFSEKLALNYETWIFKDIQLVGSLNGNRKQTNELIELSTSKNIYPVIQEYSFDDFPKALEVMEGGKPEFRCVVNVEEFSKAFGWFR